MSIAPPEKPPVLRETDAEARSLARQLLQGAAHAALASLEPQTLWPLASRVSLAMQADGVPLVLISRLSAHYDAIDQDPRCSLLVGEPGEGDPLRHARMTVLCSATKVPPSERLAARSVFVARHPGAQMYADFADFDFFRLVPQRASLNAGFGRAYSLTAADVMDVSSNC